jgi:pilus assembly protein CpaE
MQMNAIDQRVQTTRRKRVILFSSDARFREDVSTRLNSLAIYDVQVLDSEQFLLGKAPEMRPSIVILDINDPAMLNNATLAAARQSWGSVPLIAIAEELLPDQMRQLVRLRASDLLRKPLDNRDLINAVTFHDSGLEGVRSRVVTFIGASGGAGATTFALSAARHFASKSSEKAAATCLVDLDFHGANCGAYINLQNGFDLDNIVRNPDRLDVELMDVIKLTHAPGFTVYSFERPTIPFEPNGADFVLRMLDLVAYRFEEVVIDLPNQATPWFDSVVQSSDKIFIIFEVNISSLRQAKRLYAQVRELRGNDVDVTFVANKRKRKLFGNPFSQKDLEKVFKAPNIKSASLDTDLMTEALNRGLLPSEVHPRARFNKEVQKIFRERLDVGAR